jgi:hypothetical protein
MASLLQSNNERKNIMHYRNEREAREGDPVVFPNPNAGWPPIAGRIGELNANSDTCNGIVFYPVLGGIEKAWVTVRDGFHSEDALAAAQAATMPPAAETPA